MNKKLTERVTVDRKVTGVIRDLVLFARYLREVNLDGSAPDDLLVEAAREFWDKEHGE